MNRNPATDWDAKPLVMGVKDAAECLNRSASWLYRKLESGAHVPGLMPRDGSEREWQFSKKRLKDWVEGGYQNVSRWRKAS
jgi:hypothetical protein